MLFGCQLTYFYDMCMLNSSEMARTRNQALYKSFNHAGSTLKYDNMICEQMFQFCTPFVSLEDPRNFHLVLSQATFECVCKSHYKLSASKVRERVLELRNRYYAFLRFITLPGVNFNHWTSTFTIDGQYWENLERQKVI